MKNLLFGLTAVGMALGFSAFTNAPEKANRFNKTYYQQPDGTYSSATTSGTCLAQNTDPCVVNYLGSTPAAENWEFADRPDGEISTEGTGYRQ